MLAIVWQQRKQCVLHNASRIALHTASHTPRIM
ncbi:MAG: hypothetical protein RL156_1661 [Bacteroidota bacterium]|jgi:hypothetical protein